MRFLLTAILFASLNVFAQDTLDTQFQSGHNKMVILKASKLDLGKNADLSPTGIKNLEDILAKCIADNNSKEDSNSVTYLMKTKMYNRQYIPFIKDGQKQVWINCFCTNVKRLRKWRKEVVTVYDGGGCYFNVLINLTKGSYSKLYINGVA